VPCDYFLQPSAVYLNPYAAGMIVQNGEAVNLGLAMEVEGQLRVVRIENVLMKSLIELQDDIKTMAAKGKKISPEDQDLSEVVSDIE
jgi:pyruvate/2-oxoglutarate dehydrogenase complex dihydrolipoamide acyltransferase (E2) component